MVQFHPENHFDCSIENNESTNLDRQIIREILHQSHESFKLTQQSFRLALIMSAASAIVSLVGVGLLFTHNASGAIATASGLISGTSFFQLAREASEQQEKVNERLEKFAGAINQEK